MADRKYPDLLALACSPGFVFAADGDAKKLPTFKIVAYDGKPMRVGMWSYPVVIDYDGLQFAQQTPARRDHDCAQLVGHTETVEVKSNKLVCAGVISFENEHASEIVSAAKNGFPWQASVQVEPLEIEWIPEGTSTTVNGIKVSGPIDVVRKGRLKEISFVDLGASGGTKVSVAASARGDSNMKPENGNPTETQPITAAAPATAPAPSAAPIVATLSAADQAVNEMRTRSSAELQRIADVTAAAGGNQVLAAQAVRDGWTKDKTELEAIRAARPAAPAVIAGGPAEFDATVLEAAICASARLPGLEKRFAVQTLEAADKRYRGRVSLQEVLIEAARAAGWQGRSLKGDLRGGLQAAFSTLTLPGILSNSANKFLLAGFMAVERTWREIAAVRPVSDFKTVTSYRLNGGFEYVEVGPSGELEHATTGESSYTNQAKTYGRMYAITRTDIINDDLGALTALPQRIGRGAALKLNKVFWTSFLDNAAFFTSGNANYFEGAATNLQISSLTTALQKFRDQTDPDGSPLAIAPAILLVPTALEVAAASLMNSTEVRDTTATTKYGTVNPFAGMFKAHVSAYLSNAALSGSSSTAWYLLANPADLAVIEVAFLNGVEEPTVETAEADFNTLGIQMRGFHDFGVAKQEYRGGVKSKGAA